MSDTSDPQSESPREQGISLEELSQAYAEAMGEYGPRRGEPNGSEQTGTPEEQRVASSLKPDDEPPVPQADTGEVDDACELCPRTILEAMLFVGGFENEPLASTRAAELMRGVEPGEIPDLVDQLNRRYSQNGCPYRVVSQGAGYRLALHGAFSAVRNKFYGRVRQTRLSQAAIDVLAIVAYRQPLTSEEVSNLRGTASSHLLAQLVRRRLLRIDRPPGKRRPAHYFTTDRFLKLFDLETLDDLPQAEEIDNR